MKGEVWISRRQLRWLLVLLALLPVLPTIFMVRMMLDNAQRDRDVAVSEVTGVYRDQLARYVDRFSVEGEQQHGNGASTHNLSAYLHRVFGDEVSVRVTSPDGSWQLETGPSPGRDAIVVKVNVGIYQGWSVELDRVTVLPDSIDEQLRATYAQAAVLAIAVAAVAGLVYWVISGRLRVDVLKADLMSTVSHEMKTPLASMRVLLETLAEGGVSDEGQRQEYVAILLRENQRLARLADQFLTSSRLDRGEVKLPLEEVDVAALGADVVDSLQPGADEHSVEIAFTAKGGCLARANRDALAAVLGNLVENGLKYGPEGSRVEVAVHSCDPATEGVVIDVRDFGEPLSKHEGERVFERFYQAESGLNRSGGGVGLGLAISRQLTELMGGRVGWRRGEADSDGGLAGNVFFVQLQSCAGRAEIGESDPSKELGDRG